jgi:SAM-dependent methyltransferase
MPNTIEPFEKSAVALQRAAVDCELCHSSESTVLYDSTSPFMRIVRCSHCSFVYQNPRIAEVEMNDPHQALAGYQSIAKQDEAKLRMFRPRIQTLRRKLHLAETGDFLDIGTARGLMLDAMEAELPGWRLYGVEPSPSARQHLTAYGKNVVGSLEELPAGLQFDWINMDNVLEHIPEPVPLLKKVRAKLSPAGFAYVEVPNESLFSVRYRINDLVRGFPKLPTAPGHISLFTPATLKKALELAGFQDIRLRLASVSEPYRLVGALGGETPPRVKAILALLRTTKLDVLLKVAYFLVAIAR